MLASAEAERVCLAESLGLEPRHRFTDYWPLSKRLPYQLGLRLHMVERSIFIESFISKWCASPRYRTSHKGLKMAEREGLEPSRQASWPTSLANSPLHQLGYLSIKWLICRHGSHSARRSPIDQFSSRQNWKPAYIGTFESPRPSGELYNTFSKTSTYILK